MSDSANNGRWAAIVTAAVSGIGAAIGARLVVAWSGTGWTS